AEAIAHALKDEGLARNVAYVEPFAEADDVGFDHQNVRGVHVFRGSGVPPSGNHSVATVVARHAELDRPILLNCGATPANWWMHYEFAPVCSSEVLVLHDRFDQVADLAVGAQSLRDVRALLARGADAVCGLSEGSIADLPGATYVGHGVDAHWANATDLTALEPPELAAIPHPRAVYVGALSMRIDVPAVRALARSGIHVVLIGFAPTPDLENAIAVEPNVHFLGPRRPEDTIGPLLHADVGIIPHTDEPFTHSMEPHKAYNYAAAGLRTVTLNTTTAPILGPVVDATTTSDGFVAAVHAAVALGRLPAADVQRVRGITWATVAEQLLAVGEAVRRDPA
ncbi:MAG: hypothetical protein AAGC46_20535, partial [Solirubrobacteraceae bacterium]|nr:hypothetical protein [Patulibacter sp.]